MSNTSYVHGLVARIVTTGRRTVCRGKALRRPEVLIVAFVFVTASCSGADGGANQEATNQPIDAPTTAVQSQQDATETMPDTQVATMTWSRTPHDESVFGGDDEQRMWSVTGSESGFVAVGNDYAGGGEDGAVWTSPDGLTWSRVPHNEAIFGGDDDQEMRAIAESGSTYVATGIDYSGGDGDGAVWTSPDGLTWSRVPHDEAVFGGDDDQEMTAVVASDQGWVAAGRDFSGGDPDGAVWTSPDGLTWSRVPHDEAVFGGVGIQAIWSVTASGSAYVATGVDYSGGDGDGAVWTSPDGLTWSRVPHDEAVFGGDGNQGIQSAIASDSGFVAVGLDASGGDLDGAVWTSPDGMTWSRVPHDEAVFGGDGDQVVTDIVLVQSGFVAAGFEQINGDWNAAVWMSPDGVEWSRVPHDEAVFGGTNGQELWSIAASESKLVAVGDDDSGGDFDAAVWAGNLDTGGS